MTQTGREGGDAASGVPEDRDDTPPADGEDTSAIPGYQATEHIDRRELAAIVERPEPPVATPAVRPPVAPNEPVVPATPAAPAPTPAPASALGPPVHPQDPPPQPPRRVPAAPAAPAAPATPATERKHDTDEIIRRLPSPIPSRRAPEREVVVIDLPVYRLRKPGDLVGAVTATIGIAVVLLLAVFAHATTVGVTEDVQEALPSAVRTVLLAPLGILNVVLNVLEGVVTFVLPVAIGIDRLIRRQFRLVMEALLAAFLAGGVTLGLAWLLAEYGSGALQDGLTVRGVSLIPIIAAIAAFLTLTGSTDRRRLVSWTWNLLWVTLLLQVLRNGMTLPGALASVLIGRTFGLVARYFFGVLGDRAYGADLVRALRRAGIDPDRVLRIVNGRPVEGATPTTVIAEDPIGYAVDEETAADPAFLSPDPGPSSPSQPRQLGNATDPLEGAAPSGTTDHRLAHTWDYSSAIAPIPDPIAASEEESERARPPLRTAATVIGEDEGENRIYSVRDADGRVWDVGVLDGDRQVVGALTAFWNTIRLRGLTQRAVVSLRASAERTALMSYAAEAAGVRTPELRGMTTEQDSAILVSEHVPSTQALADVLTPRLTDEVLDRIWREVRVAHQAGLAHRNLDDEAILLDGEDRVWLTGWASGEVASATLARSLDLTSVLALLALRVGAERAMASAARNLSAADLQAIAPLFQPVALPERTRAAARTKKQVLNQVQELLVAVIPQGEQIQPVQMRRFSPRTIITVTIAAVAGFVVLTTFNISDMVEAARSANPWWMAAAFFLGLSTFLGSAMALVAFSPVRISLWRTTLVQVAASVVSLVAPAGVGPAALNLRFLQKNRLDTPMAVATVALVQVSQFVTTILLLLGIALVTGSSGALDTLPSGTVIAVIVVLLAIVGGLLAFPKIRRWVVAKVQPTMQQIWPRLVWVVGQPGRLATAILGNVIMTAGYVAAFGVTLLAFGETMPITQLAIVYLAGNAAGAAVPSPGGIGTVELALTTGLRAAGVAPGVALSIAFVFRLVTFWIRIPLGWLALRWLQKRSLV